MMQPELFAQKRHDFRCEMLLRHKDIEMIVDARAGNLDLTEMLTKDMLDLLQIRPLAEELQEASLASDDRIVSAASACPCPNSSPNF